MNHDSWDLSYLVFSRFINKLRSQRPRLDTIMYILLLRFLFTHKELLFPNRIFFRCLVHHCSSSLWHAGWKAKMISYNLLFAKPDIDLTGKRICHGREKTRSTEHTFKGTLDLDNSSQILHLQIYYSPKCCSFFSKTRFSVTRRQFISTQRCAFNGLNCENL
jgi:hypothetical protein